MLKVPRFNPPVMETETMKSTMALFISAALAACSTAGCSGQADSIQQEIRKHRMGTLTIRTRPGATVKVTQIQHEFWFGTAISSRMFGGRADPEDKKKYLEVLKANFNSAAPANAIKWGRTEKKRGQVNYQDADRMLKWCSENGFRTRGQCVFWAKEKAVPSWVRKLDDKALRKALESRVTDLLSHFRGQISEYDVNNEMIHGEYFAKRLGEGIRKDMFLWCRAADPKAVLCVNDFEVLTGDKLDEYEKNIEALLKAGAPVGGIGLQGHFQGWQRESVDPKKVKRVLDRLARFGLPIKITEFDTYTDDEKARTKQLVDLYRTCFAHPAVDGISMWGFWEGDHWRKAKGALWKKDWTPTPAAKAYHDLVYRQWWTKWEGKANAEGVCQVRVFFGRHLITADGTQTTIQLSKEERSKTVTID